ALRTSFANDRDGKVHEFSFERRPRERAFSIPFGNLNGLAPGLTVYEDNLYACAAPLRQFCNERLSGLHRCLLHQSHHVPSPPAVFLELRYCHITVEKSHGEANGKTVIGGTLCLGPEFRGICDALDYSRIGLNRDRPYVLCSTLDPSSK